MKEGHFWTFILQAQKHDFNNTEIYMTKHQKHQIH